MKGNIYDKIVNAVLKLKVIILLISETYEKSENFKLEYNYVIAKRKQIIPAKSWKLPPMIYNFHYFRLIFILQNFITIKLF